MEQPAGATQSIWTHGVEIPRYPKLEGDHVVDVCIVGAGIAGLSTAYMLTRAGRKVVVIEDGEIGSGETGRTTAHLVNALDDRYFEIERLHGERGAQLAAASHTDAINEIEDIVCRERIACDFERLNGYLFVPPGDDPSILERERHAIHRAGLVDVEIVDKARHPSPWFDEDRSLSRRCGPPA